MPKASPRFYIMELVHFFKLSPRRIQSLLLIAELDLYTLIADECYAGSKRIRLKFRSILGTPRSIEPQQQRNSSAQISLWDQELISTEKGFLQKRRTMDYAQLPQLASEFNAYAFSSLIERGIADHPQDIQDSFDSNLFRNSLDNFFPLNEHESPTNPSRLLACEPGSPPHPKLRPTDSAPASKSFDEHVKHIFPPNRALNWLEEPLSNCERSSESVPSYSPDPPTSSIRSYWGGGRIENGETGKKFTVADLGLDVIIAESLARKESCNGSVVPKNLQYGSERFYRKLKRGLPGYANNCSIPAIADTGAEENIISAAFARRIGLVPTGPGKGFQLGNSRKVLSNGTVDIQWSFANEVRGKIKVICHVLPRCNYDLILGRKFLVATKTLAKFRSRLVNCLFPRNHAPSVNFVGSKCMTLDGLLANNIQASGIADTGAERNVIDYDYALRHNFVINSGPENRGILQFADNTIQETLGQVKTSWTFENGACVPLTLEVLQDCCASVILGEDFLFDNNVFDSYETICVEDELPTLHNDAYLLAHFEFRNYWQKKVDDLRHLLKRKYKKRIGQGEETNDDNPTESENLQEEEMYRRNIWNYQHGFQGSTTTAIERELEDQRRARFESTLHVHHASQRSRPPRIPSISTAA